jgi:hypothetical protein
MAGAHKTGSLPFALCKREASYALHCRAKPSAEMRRRSSQTAHRQIGIRRNSRCPAEKQQDICQGSILQNPERHPAAICTGIFAAGALFGGRMKRSVEAPDSWPGSLAAEAKASFSAARRISAFSRVDAQDARRTRFRAETGCPSVPG